MLSNLPPGCAAHDIPGNRPEDQEVEFTVVLTLGELEDLQQYVERCQRSRTTTSITESIKNILEQCEPFQAKLKVWQAQQDAWTRQYPTDQEVNE